MNTDEPNAADAATTGFGVRGLVRAFGRRLVAVERERGVRLFPRAAGRALLWRQVAKAVKAVTSHRTPNLGCSCANFRYCITKRLEVLLSQ